ncbi:hypothetical protein FNF27_04875 [Cafeteria roenbergensis]|uniref:Nascent polypeptide-associated complex subunit beta n=1 Tax=Cafeteria roenbergensis TaxID=33653 RepID=A0A5A8E7P5_CAFRO|nr:hypothetical protein FNF29_05303 [Cafeteria roenbergensis]KAA0151965.1 hypothetical protein FNF31_06724 [Cafeteria roenbergensis]KAA0166947.1 hypothetical protein FNF28_03018 [Cafeteria roenbergensis]KAA0173726.1 hypothetical protein FNF27_04875 [Cafeteria roenbergensis]|mmetsp:Transcript_9491/g.37064  ORF Transcript_9491/g.37064 Transcript_9491/m.37064 type:complete len:165 (-) Transcript_9491:139-633(-)|eukprot:KAA0150290.1 hypothetical protein FNF29_05303 [Cafeteria roenbergensis]
MPGTAAENRARLRAKMEKSAGAKRGGVRKVVKKKRSNATATKERALLQVVRKQNMRSMDIEGVTMVKEDESLVTFKEPKLMLAPKGGAFVVQGKAETKTAAEGLAHLLGSMGGSSGFGPREIARIQQLMAEAKRAPAAPASGMGADVESFDDDEDDEADGVTAE